MMQADRRRSERVPLVVDLFYRVERPPELKIKFGDRVETAYLIDISASGIGFVCGTELPGNSELDITFNLSAPSGEVVKIVAVGVVRYCSFQNDRQVFRIGLVFTIIDEREEELIAEFVKNLQKDGA
jgi:c-di-GMP-binding flagellar brake protein YcgR